MVEHGSLEARFPFGIWIRVSLRLPSVPAERSAVRPFIERDELLGRAEIGIAFDTIGLRIPERAHAPVVIVSQLTLKVVGGEEHLPGVVLPLACIEKR